jgi:hypothetical protein
MCPATARPTVAHSNRPTESHGVEMIKKICKIKEVGTNDPASDGLVQSALGEEGEALQELL